MSRVAATMRGPLMLLLLLLATACVMASLSKRTSSTLPMSRWDANAMQQQQGRSPSSSSSHTHAGFRLEVETHELLVQAEVEAAPEWLLRSRAAIHSKLMATATATMTTTTAATADLTMPAASDDSSFQALMPTAEKSDDTEDQWIDDRPHEASFFLPSECPTDDRACCLSYQGEVCGGSARGSCTNVTADSTYCDMSDGGRIGMWWFTDYFDLACVCNGHYDGVACEHCAMGWEGDDCNTRSELRVRRDFQTLSDIDKQYTMDAFRLAKVTPHPFQPNVSLFDWWAVLHRWSLPGAMDDELFEKHPEFYVNEFIFGHVGTGALTYHRTLVNGIERALQIATGNFSFSLPYWNWTHSPGNDNDETLLWFGGDGSTDEPSEAPSCRDRTTESAYSSFADCYCPTARGPFAFWPLVGDWGYPMRDSTIRRAFGCNTLLAPSLPSQAASDCIVTVKEYENVVGSDGSRIHRRLLASQPDVAATGADNDDEVDAATLAQAVGGELGDEIVRTLRTPHAAKASERVRVQHSDPAHDDDDEVMWAFPFPPFHNLLGGGSPCRQARTWPNGIKFSDMHERAHRWLAGSMIYHHPASDPLFWMLHSFADLILEQWIRNAQYNGRFSLANSWAWVGENYGNSRDECQGPIFPLRRQVSMFNDTLQFGVEWDFFLNNTAERLAYAISEPTVQAYFFDGTADYLWMDRSDLNNPTVGVAYSGGDTYYSESASSFSTSDSLLDDELLSVPHASDSDIEAPLDLRFLQSYLCNSTADCCPVSGALNEICGGSTRGSCVPLSSDADLWWLTQHYSSVCECHGAYAGVACETCAFGYEGDDCSRVRSVYVRRDFSSLSDDDRQYVVDAFRTAKIFPSRLQPAVSILDFYAAVHFAMQWPVLARDANASSAAELADIISSGGGSDTSSNSSSSNGNSSSSYLESPLRTGAGALTYYRALLLHMEQEMQAMTANASFAIPYWDWTNGIEGDNDVTLRWFGGDGSTMSSVDSPLCRRPTFSGMGGCTCQVERVFKLFSVPTLWAQTLTNVTVQRSFQCLGRIAPGLPSSEVSTYALSLDNYYSSDDNVTSFARYLTGLKTDDALLSWPSSEGPDMQQRVFNWIGGTSTTMELADFRSVVSNAAADPLFWLVTAYSDSLLEQWLSQRVDAADAATLLPTDATSGVNADEHIMAIVPLITNADMFVTSTKLGYSYDRS